MPSHAFSFDGESDQRDSLRADAVVWALLALLGVGLTLHPPFALVWIALIASVGLAAISPLGGLLAVLSAAAFVFHPVPVGDRMFSLLELAVLSATAGTLMYAVGKLLTNAWSVDDFRDLFRPWSVSVAALWLLIAGTLSLFHVADPTHRAESLQMYRWVILEPVMVLGMIRVVARDRKEGWSLAGLILPGAIVATIAAVDLLANGGGVSVDGVHRADWPFPHPNNLALYLERAAVAGCGLLLLPSGVLRKVVAVLTVICTLGVLLTLSRGAFLALIVGAMVVLTVSGRLHRRLLTVLCGGALLAIGTLFALGRLTDSGTDGTRSSRELIWSGSGRMLRDHQMFGVGLDQFLYQYGRRYIDPAGWAERYTSHPHNVFLDFWLSLGLAGFALLVYLCLLVAYYAYGIATSSHQSAARIAAVASLVAGLVHGLVDNSYFRPELAMLTWVLIGIATATAKRPELESTTSPVISQFQHLPVGESC